MPSCDDGVHRGDAGRRRDYLKLQVSQANQWLRGGEIVLFSCYVDKVNRRNVTQRRVIMLTTSALYNLRPGDLGRARRVIKLLDICRLTIGRRQGPAGAYGEVVVHVAASYDYHLRFTPPDEKDKSNNDDSEEKREAQAEPNYLEEFLEALASRRSFLRKASNGDGTAGLAIPALEIKESKTYDDLSSLVQTKPKVRNHGPCGRRRAVTDASALHPISECLSKEAIVFTTDAVCRRRSTAAGDSLGMTEGTIILTDRALYRVDRSLDLGSKECQEKINDSVAPIVETSLEKPPSAQRERRQSIAEKFRRRISRTTRRSSEPPMEISEVTIEESDSEPRETWKRYSLRSDLKNFCLFVDATGARDEEFALKPDGKHAERILGEDSGFVCKLKRKSQGRKATGMIMRAYSEATMKALPKRYEGNKLRMKPRGSAIYGGLLRYKSGEGNLCEYCGLEVDMSAGNFKRHQEMLYHLECDPYERPRRRLARGMTEPVAAPTNSGDGPSLGILEGDTDEASFCVGCGEVISNGPFYSVEGRRWHKSCFGCSVCQCAFDGGEAYYMQNGWPYCCKHAKHSKLMKWFHSVCVMAPKKNAKSPKTIAAKDGEEGVKLKEGGTAMAAGFENKVTMDAADLGEGDGGVASPAVTKPKARKKKARRHTTGELLQSMGLFKLGRWGDRRKAGKADCNCGDDAIKFHENPMYSPQKTIQCHAVTTA